MSAPVQEGDILAGKYCIERVLGVGGMGVVVAARHIELEDKVAIKFLLPETLGNGEALARFAREARAAVKIKSEHTVRVSDVGTLESGAPYMVMELLHGADLGQVLQERGPLPLDEASDYILQACEAIAEAHALGIVHRDLKPPNLFLTHRTDGSPCVKVIDFGISKVTHASGSDGDQGMTRTNAIMGSPLYMSPEQLMSARDVDMRTDVWALGVILYEMLTGKAPFTADTLPQLCTTIMTAPPIAIRHHRPDLPPGIEALILGCLEKDRGKRVPTVADFALRLGAHAPKRARLSVERIERLSRAAGFSASAMALPPSSGDDQPGGRTVTEFGGTGPGTAPGRTWWIAAVASVGLLGLVAFAASRGEPDAAPAAASGARAVPSEGLPAGAVEPPPRPVVASSAEPAVAPAPEVAPSVGPSVEKPPVATNPRPKPPKATVVAAKPPSAAVEPAKVPPKPKPNCDPNFYFDAQGQKHFKRECF